MRPLEEEVLLIDEVEGLWSVTAGELLLLEVSSTCRSPDDEKSPDVAPPESANRLLYSLACREVQEA